MAAYRAIGSRPSGGFNGVALSVLIDPAHLEGHLLARGDFTVGRLDDQFFKARRFQQPFGILGAEEVEIVTNLNVLLQQAFPEAIQLELAGGILAGIAEEFGGDAIGNRALDGVRVQQAG